MRGDGPPPPAPTILRSAGAPALPKAPRGTTGFSKSPRPPLRTQTPRRIEAPNPRASPRPPPSAPPPRPQTAELTLVHRPILAEPPARAKTATLKQGGNFLPEAVAPSRAWTPRERTGYSWSSHYGGDFWDPRTKLSLKEGGLISHWPLEDPYKAYLRPKMSDEPISPEVQLRLALEVAKNWSKQKTRIKGTKVVGEAAPTQLILSDRQMESKRYMPGLDGDFHSTTTSPGYGRTPYGGPYTSFM